MINDCTIRPYQLPFEQPWNSNHGTHTIRQGFLVELKDEAGNYSCGEAAPLAEMGTESLVQCGNGLKNLKEVTLHHCAEELISQLEPYRKNHPALCCGVESAAVELLAKQNHLTLGQWLSGGSPNQIHVNQILPAIDSSAIDPAGSHIIKLKLGIAPIQQELSQIQQLALHLSPNQRLRLDANQAWHYDEAAHFLSQLHSLPIESIEEPLQKPTLESIDQLQQQCPAPIALDESVRQIGITEILDHGSLQRVVLKPMLLGGPRTTFLLAQQFQKAGIETVITSTLESSIGIVSAAYCAAAADPRQQQAHGLDTAHYFSEDLTLAPRIKNGILHLP